MNKKSFQQQLKHLRKIIDQCDQQIIKALAKRMKIVKKVGKLKKQHHIPSLDPKRWQHVVKTRKMLGKHLGLNSNLVEEIWEILHKEALSIEEKV
jgi:chorismate mutase